MYLIKTKKKNTADGRSYRAEIGMHYVLDVYLVNGRGHQSIGTEEDKKYRLG